MFRFSPFLKISSLGSLAAVFGLALSGGSALAQINVSSTFTITSDLEWRGLSLNNQYPGVAGSITAESSGFYVGVFGANYDFDGGRDNPGTDFVSLWYAGYGGDIGNGLSYDIGATLAYHAGKERVDTVVAGTTIPGVGSDDLSFLEGHVQLAYSQDGLSISAKGHYDYYYDRLRTTSGSIYGVANASYVVADAFTISGDVGSYFTEIKGLSTFIHYGVGLSYNIGYGVSIGAKWYANTLDVVEDSTADGVTTTAPALRYQAATGSGGNFLFYLSGSF